MSHILNTKYIPQTRPYSQDELKDNQQKLYDNLHLDIKNMVHHKSCNHFYFVKKNGRKAKEMIKENSTDVGNCSICWKLRKINDEFYDKAMFIVEKYSDLFYNNPTYLTYDMLDIQNIYNINYEKYNK